MNSEKDDMIDFRKLEEELANAISNDEKYKRENDAKFRAVHQKVASYDEFRDIVLASHLKPLDKKDKSGGVPYQPWNTVASNAKSDSLAKSDQSTINKNDWKIPKNSAEFDKMWKRVCKSEEEKFDFLVAIGAEKLQKLLITECPLGEILCTIKSAAVYPEHLNIVLDILESMAHTKRFSLSLDFLDKNEVNALDDVLLECKNSLDNAGNSCLQKYNTIYDLYKLENA